MSAEHEFTLIKMSDVTMAIEMSVAGGDPARAVEAMESYVDGVRSIQDEGLRDELWLQEQAFILVCRAIKEHCPRSLPGDIAEQVIKIRPEQQEDYQRFDPLTSAFIEVFPDQSLSVAVATSITGAQEDLEFVQTMDSLEKEVAGRPDKSAVEKKTSYLGELVREAARMRAAIKRDAMDTKEDLDTEMKGFKLTEEEEDAFEKFDNLVKAGDLVEAGKIVRKLLAKEATIDTAFNFLAILDHEVLKVTAKCRSIEEINNWLSQTGVSNEAKEAILLNWDANVLKNTFPLYREQGSEVAEAYVKKNSSPERLDKLLEALSIYKS